MQQTLGMILHADIDYNPAINARGGTETDLTSICATLRAKGLVQPLMVRNAPNGRYEPVEGGRRYRAIGQLIAEGHWDAAEKIPALIRDLSDAEAIELSLIAAVERVPLNPADEAASFAKLVSAGETMDSIALTFGIPTRRVKQRLAIAGLPKKIVSALRAGTINVEQAEAYTIGRDKKQIEKLFDEDGRASATWIRNALTQKRIRANDPRALFVGLDAYRAANGFVDEDLFSNDAWLSDSKLLDRLFEKKLKAEEALYLKAGWSFVVIERDRYNPKFQHGGQLEPEVKPKLSTDQKLRKADLKETMKKLRKQIDDETGVRHDDDNELDDALAAAEAEYKALTGNTFSEAQRQKSGVLIHDTYHGWTIDEGILQLKQKAGVKKSKQKTAPTTRHSREGGNPASLSTNREEPEADFTAGLNMTMAKVMTEAMQATIIAKPGLAKRALAAVLMYSDESFHLAYGREAQRSAETDKEFTTFHDSMPESDPFEALVKRADDEINAILAVMVACAFTLRSDVHRSAKPFIDMFNPDVAATWQPDEAFFKSMPRAMLAAALGEAAIPGATPSKKKGELVAMCLRDLQPLGWLPAPLRTPCYKGPGSNQWSDAHAARLADDIRHSREGGNPASLDERVTP